MKEIKFRYIFKDKEGKIYTKIFSLRDIERDGLQNVIMGFDHDGIDIKIIAKDRFTGLYDKNKKEIYEGDILDVDIIMGEGEHRGVHSTYKGIVVFKDGCFNLDIMSVEYYGSEARIDNEGYEGDTLINIIFENEPKIIGNIYEDESLTKKI